MFKLSCQKDNSQELYKKSLDTGHGDDGKHYVGEVPLFKYKQDFKYNDHAQNSPTMGQGSHEWTKLGNPYAQDAANSNRHAKEGNYTNNI